jgi:hypothetical protein
VARERELASLRVLPAVVEREHVHVVGVGEPGMGSPGSYGVPLAVGSITRRACGDVIWPKPGNPLSAPCWGPSALALTLSQRERGRKPPFYKPL